MASCYPSSPPRPPMTPRLVALFGNCDWTPPPLSCALLHVSFYLLPPWNLQALLLLFFSKERPLLPKVGSPTKSGSHSFSPLQVYLHMKASFILPPLPRFLSIKVPSSRLFLYPWLKTPHRNPPLSSGFLLSISEKGGHPL